MQTILLDQVQMDKKLITNSLELWLPLATITITTATTTPTRDQQTRINDYKIPAIRDQITKTSDHNNNSKQCLRNNNMSNTIITITIMIYISSKHKQLLQLPT